MDDPPSRCGKPAWLYDVDLDADLLHLVGKDLVEAFDVPIWQSGMRPTPA